MTEGESPSVCEVVDSTSNSIIRQVRLSAERTNRTTTFASELILFGIYLPPSLTLLASINVPFHSVGHALMVHLQFHISLHADGRLMYSCNHIISQPVARGVRGRGPKKVRIDLNFKQLLVLCRIQELLKTVIFSIHIQDSGDLSIHAITIHKPPET